MTILFFNLIFRYNWNKLNIISIFIVFFCGEGIGVESIKLDA